MQLQILRNAQEVVSVEIDKRTVFTHKLMSEHKIVSDFIASQALDLQLGDYVVLGQEKYYINRPPEVEKINNFTFRYVVTFEAEIYKLYNKLLRDEGAADFSYSGTAKDFLLLILENINATDPGWAIARVDDTEVKTIPFSGASCRTAITMIADAFELEYRLVNKNIYLERSVGFDTTLQFEYGRGRGLYKLTRNNIEEKNLVTRLYGYGAKKNLKYNYRGGATRLMISGEYLEKNVDIYGVREGSVIFEEVFPQRTGTVTAIDANNTLCIYDEDLEFNINDYLLEGTVAKIVFKSGALSGYEFEITHYDPYSKKIIFNPFVEENDYTLPNDLNFPVAGDTYTLVDIEMPEIYISDAEAELRQKMQQYLDENSSPRVSYQLSLDEKYIRERGIDLMVAALVRVTDTDLGIGDKIRVAEINYPLVNPEEAKITIADTIPYTVQEQNIADTIDNQTEIRNVDRNSVELARRAALRMKQLKDLLFDPDGYFDPENLKPQSIETLLLSVGAKSRDFGLIGVTIQANYEGANVLKISAGKLAHYQIEIEGLGYVWDMDPRTFEGLDPAKHYWVYAKCSKTELHGTWELYEDPRLVDAEEGYYLFNLGILYEVKDGRRDFDFTNGMTYINGDTITTGKLKSQDGLNYFDLDQGQFKIGNDTSSLDFNVTNEGRLTLKGVLVSSMILADSAVIEALSVRSLRTADEGRRLEILESENNMVIYNSAGNEVVRVDDGVNNFLGIPSGAGLVATAGNGKKASVTTDGIYSEMANVLQAVSGLEDTFGNDAVVRSAVAGMLSYYSHLQYDYHAGVLGVNPYNYENFYGGIFQGGLLVSGGKNGFVLEGGMRLKPKNIEYSYTIVDNDVFVVCYNQNNISVKLPSSPKEGRMVFVKRVNSANVELFGNGKRIIRSGVRDSVNVGGEDGDLAMMYFDGYYWHYNLIRQ